MAVTPPSQEEIKNVRAEFGLDEQGIKEAVNHLKDWLNLQPHLPHNCEDARLERWIIICKNSLERAKSSIDLYYTLKNVVPELLTDRDPGQEWFKKAADMGYTLPLSHLTEDHYRVVLVGLKDFDADKADMLHIYKTFLMITEIGLCEDYAAGIICVINMEGFTMGHVAKISLPLLRKFLICFLKALNVRVKEMLFVNAPPFAEIVVNLVKSGMKAKLVQRVHMYPKGALNLTDKISPKILPVEYGGQNGTIREIQDALNKKFADYRNWFVEQDKYKADESKRPGKAFDSGELFGFEGSFRQLSVD